MKKGLVGGISLAVIIVLAVVIVGMCSVRVPTGYVAVQYSMNGGVKDEVLTQGWHITSPTITTTLYSVGLQQSYLTSTSDGDSKDDESFVASSSEGKAITIDLTFTYQYQADDVVDVFNRFSGQSGKEVRDSFIKPNIISWTKEILAQYKVSDIIGSERGNINTVLSDYLSEKFEPYGITISNVSLINIDVDDETMEAINAKITAQQNAETQAITNQTNIDKAEAEAQVKLTEAQAEADALLIAAQAEADVLEVQATSQAEALAIQSDAQAAANKLISESLTDDLLMQQYISQWDGALPKISMSDSSEVIMDMSELMSDATEEE